MEGWAQKTDFLIESRSRETTAGVFQLSTEDCSVGKVAKAGLRRLGTPRSQAGGKKPRERSRER